MDVLAALLLPMEDRLEWELDGESGRAEKEADGCWRVEDRVEEDWERKSRAGER